MIIKKRIQFTIYSSSKKINYDDYTNDYYSGGYFK